MVGVAEPPDKAKFDVFETLGEKGWDVPRPSTMDSVAADVGGVRGALARYGIGFLGLGAYTIAADALHERHGPQVYNGQRPTFNSTTQLSVSLNLSQYGIPNAQVTAAGAAVATSWKPLGPRETSLIRLWYFQSFLNDKLEVKIGYNALPVEFLGTFVGGNIVSGTLGPKASIPFQTGEARIPVSAPEAQVRVQGPDRFYVKSAVQRSVDPAGAQAEHNANQPASRSRRRTPARCSSASSDTSARRARASARCGYGPVRSTTPAPIPSSGRHERRRTTPPLPSSTRN